MENTKTPLTYTEAIEFINNHDILDGDEVMSWLLYIQNGVIMCHAEDDSRFERFGKYSSDPKTLNWYLETITFDDGVKSTLLCATTDSLDSDYIFNTVWGMVFDKGSYQLRIRSHKHIWADYLLRDGKYDEYDEYVSKNAL